MMLQLGEVVPKVPQTAVVNTLPVVSPLPPCFAGGFEIEWPLLALRVRIAREVVCKGEAGGSPSPVSVLVILECLPGIRRDERGKPFLVWARNDQLMDLVIPFH